MSEIDMQPHRPPIGWTPLSPRLGVISQPRDPRDLSFRSLVWEVFIKRQDWHLAGLVFSAIRQSLGVIADLQVEADKLLNEGNDEGRWLLAVVEEPQRFGTTYPLRGDVRGSVEKEYWTQVGLKYLAVSNPVFDYSAAEARVARMWADGLYVADLPWLASRDVRGASVDYMVVDDLVAVPGAELESLGVDESVEAPPNVGIGQEPPHRPPIGRQLGRRLRKRGER